MLNRYMSAGLFGFAVTGMLFYVMSTLIATGINPLSDDKVGKIVDFIRIKQDESIQTKARKVEKPDSPVSPITSDPSKDNTKNSNHCVRPGCQRFRVRPHDFCDIHL